jgi:predicted ATPase
MTHFPPFRFDSHNRTLWRRAAEVPLTPKASALLACLLASRGAWVSKKEILAAVWPDTHVHPDNIKVLVSEIRHALGDSSLAPTYIRSVARGGYAFVAPITNRDDSNGSDWLRSSRAHPFVNRARELAMLTAMLETFPAASPRLALITGDHGGGKTSLCEALLREFRLAGSARTCFAQCNDRELPQEPYYPILDALLRLDRQHPGLVPAVLAEHAPSWLALFPQWRGTHRRRAAKARIEMLDELRDAVAMLARDLPLVMVVDDLQWADGETLRALMQLGEPAGDDRVLIVTTCNEGEWCAGPEARRRFTATARLHTIPLPPFTPQQTDEYVIARFGAGPLEALASMVHTVTGGNPMMVAAAFDWLVERRLITLGTSGWRRESSIEALGRSLPETLSEAVSRQLEQLESHEREAIEAAAAVGFEFTLAAVAMALRCHPDDVSPVLGPLARRGQLIVADNTDGAVPAHANMYRFRHPFYVDVIGRHAPLLRQRAFADRIAQFRGRPRRVAT